MSLLLNLFDCVFFNFLIIFSMGNIKQGILGGFSGKVGTVIGSSWKGINYMRGLAPNIKDARTAKQLAQREKFALALSFLRPMQSFIRVGFKMHALRQTAFNAAMSYTLRNVVKGVSPNLSIDFAKVMVSRGSLLLPLNIQRLNNDGEIALSWVDNSGVGNALDSDFAMPMAYNADKNEVVYDMASSCRGDEGVGLDYPSNWVGDTVHVYLGFVSENGSLVSDSVYVGEMVIEN